MVGLAMIMHEKGCSVSGSDIADSKNTQFLQTKGISITIGHSPDNIPMLKKGKLLVVRSSAVNDSNPEYQTAVNAGHSCIRRGEMLAKVAESYQKTVAIAGSHGKTSVTALLVHILKSAGFSPGYMIGGKVSGWQSSAAAGDGTLFITESDESDGTQIHLKSDILLITNIEDDHSWSLGGSETLFANFAKIARNSRKLIFNATESTEKLLEFHQNKRKIDFNHDFFTDKKDWGNFQKENANLAIEGSVELGVARKTAYCEVRKFPGVERRMTTRFNSHGLILIEDYAHHPTEVKAAIETLRERFPAYQLKVIFQPHRYARLNKYIDEFAGELAHADEVIIVPVFSAWTETGPVNSADLAKKIGKKAKYMNESWPSIAEAIIHNFQPPEVIAVLGAGDIEEIIPALYQEIDRKFS